MDFIELVNKGVGLAYTLGVLQCTVSTAMDGRMGIGLVFIVTD